MGLDWTGLDCTALHCIRLNCIILYCTAMEWITQLRARSSGPQADDFCKPVTTVIGAYHKCLPGEHVGKILGHVEI